MVGLSNHSFDAAVEGGPLAPGAKGDSVFLAANRVHLGIHEWLGIVMISSHGAVVAITRLLERLERPRLDENFVILHQLHPNLLQDDAPIAHMNDITSSRGDVGFT